MSQPYTTLARQYAESVLAGDLPACRWVQRACQRQLDDLVRFNKKSSPFQLNPKIVDQTMARKSAGFRSRFGVAVDRGIGCRGSL